MLDLPPASFRRSHSAPQPVATQRVAPLQLSQQEVRSYSLMRAVDAARRGDWTAAGFEHEVSEEEWRRIGATSIHGRHAFRAPHQILMSQRDLTTSVMSAGGALVETKVDGVIDALRARMIVARLGAQRLTGLKANTVYARQGSTSSVTWAPTEGTQATETATFNLGQMSLAPKTVCAYLEESRLLRLMAPDLAEFTIRRDLARTLATALDSAALNGAGASGEPSGLLTYTLGTFNGASITYANTREAETDVLTANALSDGGEVAFTCRPAVASTLSQRQGFSTTAPLWTGPLAEGQINGCRAISSMQVPASTLVAGDWSQLLLAEWAGGVEIRVNPYANFQAGITGFGAFLTTDIGVLSTSAFSVATSVT